MWQYNYTTNPNELYHHGIKGQKWGVRHGPPYPLKKKSLTDSSNESTIRITISGHASTPKKSAPNSIIDHKSATGKIDVRTFYDENGVKSKDIHTTDHGNPKQHNYGKNGEHVHEYEWYDDGSLKNNVRRDLKTDERKENRDIL